MRVKATAEFNNNGLRIRVVRFFHQVQELIKVSIDGATALEVGLGLQAVDGCNVCMGWTKLPLELASEFLPIKEFVESMVLRLLFPPENSLGPFGCSPGLHVRHGPNYLGLIIRKCLQTKTDIYLA